MVHIKRDMMFKRQKKYEVFYNVYQFFIKNV